MHLRVDIRGYRFYVAVTHSKKVKGVNSRLPGGKHFLMWDFDDKPEHDVVMALRLVQQRFRLSTIYLLNTGLPNYWHAYCFSTFDYPDLLRILASTPFLDEIYFRIGVLRGYYTLRYSPKGKREFKLALVLASSVKEAISPFEVTSFVEYWTKRVK